MKYFMEETQIDKLANYIMANIPGEPSQSEGAGDTAIRLLSSYRFALHAIMDNLGVPQPDYPAPITEAYNIAQNALGH